MTTRLLFLHALSPLHAGTGQGVGVIDLPIAREKATGIPYVPGATVKGVLRDASEAAKEADTIRVFGPDTNNAELHAGSLQIADARLLLLPVRSVLGTFAWVTSPYLLHRLVRDGEIDLAVPKLENESSCFVAQNGSALASRANDAKVYLEDLDLTATPDAAVTAWAAWLGEMLFPALSEPDPATPQEATAKAAAAHRQAEHWRAQLAARLCVVHDNVLSFLLQTATEVRARIKMDDSTKTVDQKVGGLWYEEALPAETVLASLAAVLPVRVNGRVLTDADVFGLVGRLAQKPLQFGGKATVGYGVCSVRLGA